MGVRRRFLLPPPRHKPPCNRSNPPGASVFEPLDLGGAEIPSFPAAAGAEDCLECMQFPTWTGKFQGGEAGDGLPTGGAIPPHPLWLQPWLARA